jgi:hypothetical protein
MNTPLILMQTSSINGKNTMANLMKFKRRAIVILFSASYRGFPNVSSFHTVITVTCVMTFTHGRDARD